MADNAAVLSDATTELFKAATDEVPYSGQTAHVQLVRLVHVSGAEGSKVVTDLGGSSYHVVAAASANAANIKASAGVVYGIDIFNNAAYPIYVKLHNTSGAPTPGSGVVRAFGVQAGVHYSKTFPLGLAFTTGIGISIVTGITDASAAAVAANDCVVDVEYK
jgi:hypothetical protein